MRTYEQLLEENRALGAGNAALKAQVVAPTDSRAWLLIQEMRMFVNMRLYY